MSPSTLERSPRTSGDHARRSTHRVDTHPRVAARRHAVARRRSRRHVVLLVCVAVVVVLGGALWPLAHSRWLSARVLKVIGNHHTPKARILAAAGLSSHPPLIDIHAASAARAVDALPWVDHAVIVRDWPDAVVVRVSERRAVAVVADSGTFAQLDRSGRVLATVSSAPSSLVRIVSVRPPGAPGSTLKGAKQCLVVAASLPPALSPLVSAISPSPGGGVDLALGNGIGVVLGAPTQLRAKYEDVASLLAGSPLAAGSVIDVSVPPSPVVSPPAPSSTHS